MVFDNSYIFFFCALGVFNCLLVSIYFLLLQKKPLLKNRLFGLLTLLLSIRVGKTVYMSFENSSYLSLAQVGLSACFLIGISLYYYVRADLEKREAIPKSWLVHFGALFFIILLVGLTWPYPMHVEFWNTYFVWFIYFTWGIYILASGYELREQLHMLIRYPRKSSTGHTWLVLVALGNLLLFTSYLVGYFWLYLVEMLTFSVVIYALIFYYLSRSDRDSIFQDRPEKYARKRISAVEAQHLREHLERLMKNEQLYKNPDLKLEELSASLNISHHKLSQLLNDNIGESFRNYINRHRVENAIRLLQEKELFTVEAIAYESGFTSKSGFYTTFKKITGTTPANFRKQFNT